MVEIMNEANNLYEGSIKKKKENEEKSLKYLEQMDDI